MNLTELYEKETGNPAPCKFSTSISARDYDYERWLEKKLEETNQIKNRHEMFLDAREIANCHLMICEEGSIGYSMAKHFLEKYKDCV